MAKTNYYKIPKQLMIDYAKTHRVYMILSTNLDNKPLPIEINNVIFGIFNLSQRKSLDISFITAILESLATKYKTWDKNKNIYDYISNIFAPNNAKYFDFNCNLNCLTLSDKYEYKYKLLKKEKELIKALINKFNYWDIEVI